MRFRDQYFFLSNFYETPVTVPIDRAHPEKGYLTFRNAEAAYQAYKCEGDKEAMKSFTTLYGADAKRAGYHTAVADIEAWKNKRLDAMRYVLTAKFTQNKELAKQLMAVTEPIIEENFWNDTFWGVCHGRGENHLGRLLEEIRQELLKTQSEN